MGKDTTAFRRRFEDYKNGKPILLIYDGGYIKEPVITPDELYNEYINSLPDNLRLTSESSYRSYRYWELNGKPKNFAEAIGKGMFDYDFTDNTWHAKSAALNEKTGEYEFMKPNWHDTKMYEDAWYYSKNGELFRNQYTKKVGAAYDKYVPKYKNGKPVSEIYDAGLPRYEDGKPELVDDATLDFIIKHEGFVPDTLGKDPVTGAPYIGSGIEVQKYLDQFNRTGKWSAEDNRNAVREIAQTYTPHLKRTFGKVWPTLTPELKTVLYDVAYNIGVGKLNSTYSPGFVNAVLSGNTEEAKRQMNWGNHLAKGLRNRNKDRQAIFGTLAIQPKVQAQEPSPYIAKPVSTAVRPVIKEEKTVPAYDPTISPYISGKPMLKLTPRVQLPNIIDLIEDSLWDPEYDVPQIIYPKYKDGKSPIHINPANRGKFNATKKRTGKTTEQLAHSSNPLTRKRAIFALNARKWHH